VSKKNGLPGCDGQAAKADFQNSTGANAITVAKSQEFCIAAFDHGSKSGPLYFQPIQIASDDLPVVAGQVEPRR